MSAVPERQFECMTKHGFLRESIDGTHSPDVANAASGSLGRAQPIIFMILGKLRNHNTLD